MSVSCLICRECAEKEESRINGLRFNGIGTCSICGKETGVESSDSIQPKWCVRNSRHTICTCKKCIKERESAEKRKKEAFDKYLPKKKR